MKKLIYSIVILLMAGIAVATTNEIVVVSSLKVNKNSTEINKTSGQQLIQMAGNRFYSSVYSLTTTNQSMAKGAIANLGWTYIRNLSTNNTIAISFDSCATTNMHLLPSEAAVFRLAPSFQVTNIHAAVSTGGVADLEFTVVEK